MSQSEKEATIANALAGLVVLKLFYGVVGVLVLEVIVSHFDR